MPAGAAGSTAKASCVTRARPRRWAARRKRSGETSGGSGSQTCRLSAGPVALGSSRAVTAAWAWWAAVLAPPIWLQFAVTVPAMLAGCLAALRPVKAWLVAEQYVNKASEATWDSVGTHGAAPARYRTHPW